MLVVSDIHANMNAFEAVLGAEEGSWEGFLCLGDITGYGPDPEECVGAVRDLAERTAFAVVLAGNHDAALSGVVPLSWFGAHARASVIRTSEAVSPASKAWLSGLPASLTIPESLAPARTFAVHASPNELLTGYLFGGDETALALETLGRQGVVACLCGHTHVSAAFHAGGVVPVACGDDIPGAVGIRGMDASIAPEGLRVSLREGPVIVNPGSVGLPRFPGKDGGGSGDSGYVESAWPARYGLWDTDTRIFCFREVLYDRRSATERLLALGTGW